MNYLLALLLSLPLLLQAPDGKAQGQENFPKLEWIQGPRTVAIDDKATFDIPDQYVFLDEANTGLFLKAMGNPPSPGRYVFAPKKFSWFAILFFYDGGYVIDDDIPDPETLLKDMKSIEAVANEARHRLGGESLYLDRWFVPTNYDAKARILEWGVWLRNQDNEVFLNYNLRVLGRRGFMNVTMVGPPMNIESGVREFRQSLAHLRFKPGETYADFKQGDKVAGYGLAGLVMGGAAASAQQKGLWTLLVDFLGALWKQLAGLALAGVAFIRWFLKRKQ